FYLALGGLDHFKAQAIVFDYLALLRNATSQLADQSRYRCRLPALGPHPEQLVQPVYVHVARHHIGMLAFTHDLRLLVFIADFADNLFDEAFDGHQPGSAATFIYTNGHAYVRLLT